MEDHYDGLTPFFIELGEGSGFLDYLPCLSCLPTTDEVEAKKAAAQQALAWSLLLERDLQRLLAVSTNADKGVFSNGRSQFFGAGDGWRFPSRWRKRALPLEGASLDIVGRVSEVVERELKKLKVSCAFGSEKEAEGEEKKEEQDPPMPHTQKNAGQEGEEEIALEEDQTSSTFNSVLVNRYENGEATIGWHQDDSPELGSLESIVIGSVSLGAPRLFEIRRKPGLDTPRHLWGQRASVMLQPGSLLIMRGSMQQHWQHRLAPDPACTAPRLNLTFRRIKT